MSKSKRTISNLKQFLTWRGCGDSPYGWARAFYKYTDCGPWAVFITEDGEAYYEDKAVNDVTNDNCTGIRFGSIVEGSDQCSGPFTHMFPFNASAFEEDIEYMEKETSYFWKRDNATWYRVETDDEEWTVADVDGEIEWDTDPPPEDIKAAAENAIENDWQDHPRISGAIRRTIPVAPSIWKTAKPGWEPMDLGVAGATIHSYENDTPFD